MKSEPLAPLTRSVLNILANVYVETLATQAAVVGLNPQSWDLIVQTREAIRQQWKPLLDSLEQSTHDSVEDMLRKFEGPVN